MGAKQINLPCHCRRTADRGVARLVWVDVRRVSARRGMIQCRRLSLSRKRETGERGRRGMPYSGSRARWRRWRGNKRGREGGRASERGRGRMCTWCGEKGRGEAERRGYTGETLARSLARSGGKSTRVRKYRLYFFTSSLARHRRVLISRNGRSFSPRVARKILLARVRARSGHGQEF